MSSKIANSASKEKVSMKKSNESKKMKSSKEKEVPVPRGRPKSGRPWKTEKTKFTSIIKTKGIRDKYEKRRALKIQLKQLKDQSRAIIEAKKQEVEQKKERRRSNLQRQEENRKKAEIVQVIKNPSKIKRMKKKQLRMIEKRDTTNM